MAPKVQEMLHENEARVKVLTEEWAGKWKEMANILQVCHTIYKLFSTFVKKISTWYVFNNGYKTM